MVYYITEEAIYDYLIVAAGLSGAIFAHEATKQRKKIKVIDKCDHIGETSIVRTLKKSTFSNIMPPFSKLLTKKFGIM
ncbi:NAD(P)-binding protein [Gemella sp. 20925_1_85]|uniref:NAD(P)-binding protein n=1 Tax=Gemella sp. 20925_1_85 TaxID=3003690 RepID=UPI00352EB331